MAPELGIADFHLKHSCPGNCGRSHACPVRINGWTCNGDHSPDKCTSKGKLELSWTPELIERCPTNDEPVSAPIDGTGDLADYFVPASEPRFSNPTGTGTFGSGPYQFSRSPWGLFKTFAGRVSNGSFQGHFTTSITFSVDRLFAGPAPTRAPLGPFGSTLWGADTRPAIVIYWQSRFPES